MPEMNLSGRTWVPQSIASVLLVWALYPENPYAYYILLRWICCPIFVFLAVQASENGQNGWVWAFGVTAVLYNPIFPVHLNREIWSVLNIATIVLLAISVVRLKRWDQAANVSQVGGAPRTAESEPNILREADYAFYRRLGLERSDVTCKHTGCTRGAIALSVFCRVHHFEQVRKKACPFND